MGHRHQDRTPYAGGDATRIGSMDGELRELVEPSEPPSAVGRLRSVPTGESAAICPACGAVRAVRPGLVPWKSTRRVIPKAIGTALELIPALTPQERKTFELLGLGYDNRSIARAFEVSERTVKRHVSAILSKLKLESRLQAGLAALLVSSLTETGGYWPESYMDSPSEAG
jgi:DNA-binding CsgD family transcriptional regulator